MKKFVFIIVFFYAHDNSAAYVYKCIEGQQIYYSYEKCKKFSYKNNNLHIEKNIKTLSFPKAKVKLKNKNLKKHDKKIIKQKQKELKKIKLNISKKEKAKKKEALKQLKYLQKQQDKLAKKNKKCKILELNIDFINNQMKEILSYKKNKNLEHKIKKLYLEKDYSCR